MEIWKDIVINNQNTGWKVSNYGRVQDKYQIIKIGTLRKDYLRVSINYKTYNIHKLVAEAFIPYTGLNPDGTPIIGERMINHIDENKRNNHVENLEWCDAKYNNNYGTRSQKASLKMINNKYGIGNKSNSKKVQCIETGEIFESTREAARKYNLQIRAVCCAANPKHNQKKAGGYTWRYYYEEQL